MKNPFFKIALALSYRHLGKPVRILQLIAQMSHRLYFLDRADLSLNRLREKLLTYGRLVSSYSQGHYREISLKSLLTIIAGILYFLNPMDLVPDVLLGVGFTDDLAVLTWVYQTTQEELKKYLAWEAIEMKE